MKSSDRTVLIVLASVGLLAAFWMLVVSPKRDQISELEGTADQLRSSVSALKAEAAAGEAAREDFPQHYKRMVVLGKAVPADHEEGDLIVGLQRLGERADVEFRSITLGASSGAEAPEIVRPNPATGQDPIPESGSGGDATGASPAAAAQPTETAAAALPIGASVGPAGLGVMPWDIIFDGDFFDLQSVFAGIDYLVRFDDEKSKVRGRLVTVDGFALEMLDDKKEPRLAASLAVRSFVSPKGEGVTLGATPTGPATTPVSSEVSP